MRRFLLPLLFLLTILTGCKTRSSNQEPAASLSLAEIEAQAPSLVDKMVKVEGTVMHVCRESGKRLFLGEESFKVLASNKIGRFDVALEGSDVIATGILKEDRITEDYLNNWEKELQTDAQVPLKEAIHTGEAGHDEADESATETQLGQIKNYREQIAASDKGYLSFYSLEVVNLKEIK